MLFHESLLQQLCYINQAQLLGISTCRALTTNFIMLYLLTKTNNSSIYYFSIHIN